MMTRRLAVLVATSILSIGNVVSPAYADDIRDKQWHLSYLNVADAQEFSKGQGVIVAVIDTGVDATHVDLTGNVLPGTVTYVGAGRTGGASHDIDGHGTGMAGDIAAHGHGVNDGTLGIAPSAKILPIADTDDAGHATDDAMAEGINYAIRHGARVISLSQGGAGVTAALTAAVNNAEEAGVVVVAAAGDRSGGDLTVDVPANLPGVVAVAAVGRDGEHLAESVSGPAIVLAAPGAEIVSASPNGGYVEGTGTSDAAAIIAGAVALVRAKYPNLSATEVIHRLTATATDKGPPGRDDEYGYGVINIVAALTADVPPLAPSVSPSPTSNDQPANNPSPTAQQPIRTRSALPFVIAAVAAVLVLLAVLGWWLVRRRGVSSP